MCGASYEQDLIIQGAPEQEPPYKVLAGHEILGSVEATELAIYLNAGWLESLSQVGSRTNGNL